jgi:phosphoenolpyruvate carboxykinase (GTP)
VDITPEQAAELFAVNAESWLAEADLTEEYYARFGDRVPAALRGQLDALRSRLQQA